MSKLTSEQRAFVNEVKYQVEVMNNGGNPTNILLHASAGSGKTTSIISAIKELNSKKNRILLVAFNKIIADELREKVSDYHIDVKTINALGHFQLNKRHRELGLKSPKLCFDRMRDVDPSLYCHEWVTFNINNKKMMTSHTCCYPAMIKQLSHIVMANGYFPNTSCDMIDNNKDFTISSLTDILKDYGKKCISKYEILAIWRSICEYIGIYTNIHSISFQENNTLDFNDQVWLPLMFSNKYGKNCLKKTYDVIFVDESQDLSYINMMTLKSLMNKDGIIVGVGDKYQAIFQFRGADSAAMENFAMEMQTKDLHLTNTFRCGQQITKNVKVIHKNFSSLAKHEGKVYYIDLSLFKLEYCDSYKTVIISDTYNDLVNFAIHEISKGITNFYSPEVGNKFSKKSLAYTITTAFKLYYPDVKYIKLSNYKVEDMVKVLNKLYESYKDHNMKFNDAKRYESLIIEKSTSLLGIVSKMFIGDNKMKVDVLVDKVSDIFSDMSNYNKGDFRLYSIHKVKGKEYDTVVFYSSTMHRNKNEYQKVDNKHTEIMTNLSYVAKTRAINTLHHVYSNPMQRNKK